MLCRKIILFFMATVFLVVGVSAAEPEGAISRYQFMRQLNTALGLTVDESNWETALENHIVASGEAGLLNPAHYSRANAAQPISRYEAAVLLSAATVSVLQEPLEVLPAPALYFRDYATLPAVYQGRVADVYCKGIMTTRPDGTFDGWTAMTPSEATAAIAAVNPAARTQGVPPTSPTQLVSRGDFLSMMNQVLWLDVDVSNWQTRWQNTLDGAAAAALTTGLTPTLATLSDPISRFEVAQLLANALARNGEAPVTSSLCALSVTDWTEIPTHMLTTVSHCLLAGVMAPDPNNAFLGWESVTLGDATYMLHQLTTPKDRDCRVFGGFTQIIGICETKYRTSNHNRRFNINRSTHAISGTIIPPGGQLDFNAIVGNPGKDNGYLLAGVILAGKAEVGYGGGVCQVSTTLYAAALQANLAVVKRANHGLRSDYFAPGLDAAVYYPQLNLVLQNPYQQPIQVVGINGADSTLTFYILAQPDLVAPKVALSVTRTAPGKYTLLRTADGRENYRTQSVYQ